ncbi:hypothetical protein BJX99DRAFT_57983 [Aspergillus californicus]
MLSHTCFHSCVQTIVSECITDTPHLRHDHHSLGLRYYRAEPFHAQFREIFSVPAAHLVLLLLPYLVCYYKITHPSRLMQFATVMSPGCLFHPHHWLGRDGMKQMGPWAYRCGIVPKYHPAEGIHRAKLFNVSVLEQNPRAYHRTYIQYPELFLQTGLPIRAHDSCQCHLQHLDWNTARS